MEQFKQKNTIKKFMQDLWVSEKKKRKDKQP